MKDGINFNNINFYLYNHSQSDWQISHSPDSTIWSFFPSPNKAVNQECTPMKRLSTLKSRYQKLNETGKNIYLPISGISIILINSNVLEKRWRLMCPIRCYVSITVMTTAESFDLQIDADWTLSYEAKSQILLDLVGMQYG